MRKMIVCILALLSVEIAQAQVIMETLTLEHNKPVEREMLLEGYSRKSHSVPLLVEFTFDQQTEILQVILKYNGEDVRLFPYDMVWLPQDHIWFAEMKKFIGRKYGQKVTVGKQFKKQAKEYRKNRYKLVPALASDGAKFRMSTEGKNSKEGDFNRQLFDFAETPSMKLEFDIPDKAVHQLSVRFCNPVPVTSRYIAFSRKKKFKLHYAANDQEYYLRIKRDPCLDEAAGMKELEYQILFLRKKLEDLAEEKQHVVENYGQCYYFEQLKNEILRECDDLALERKYQNAQCSVMTDSLQAYNKLRREIAALACDSVPACEHPDNRRFLDSVTVSIGKLKNLHNRLTIEKNRGNVPEFLQLMEEWRSFDKNQFDFMKLWSQNKELPVCTELWMLIDRYQGFFGEVDTTLPPCLISPATIFETTSQINDMVSSFIKTKDRNLIRNFDELVKRQDRIINSASPFCKTHRVKEAIKSYEGAKELFHKTVKRYEG